MSNTVAMCGFVFLCAINCTERLVAREF